MAQFKMAVTRAGRELLAASAAGNAVTFRRISLGDGIYTGDLSGMEALISERHRMEIQRVSRTENRVELRGVLTTDQIAQPFEWRELGVYAETASGEEVLVVYGSTGGRGDRLGEIGGIAEEREIVLTLLVGQKETVTEVSGVLYASQQQLDRHLQNAEIHAAPGEKISVLHHWKSGNSHVLTGSVWTGGLTPFVFSAADDFQENDRILFGAEQVPLTIRLSDGSAADSGLFTRGCAVFGILDWAGKIINFKQAGGVHLPAGTAVPLARYTDSGTFEVPKSGTYRITVIGRGGKGADTNQYQSYAAGGGAGGAACGEWQLHRGDRFPVTVSPAQSSFGNLLTAVRGQDAAEGNIPGNGGNASGGIYSYTGGAGREGESELVTNAWNGGEGGAYSEEQAKTIPVLPIYGGRGGIPADRLPYGIRNGKTLSAGVYAVGAGGGGAAKFDTLTGSGAIGSGGAVIVEWIR